MKKDVFKDYPLLVIPIAPNGYIIESKHYIYSAGCPYRTHPMSWEGYITSIKSWVEFKPFPLPGQSGSPIYGLIKGKDGELYTRVIGIITWTSDDPNGVGGAVPIQAYYDLFDKPSNVSDKYSTKIPVTFRYANDYAIDKDVQYEGRIFPLPRPFNGRLQEQLTPEQPILPNLRPDQPILPNLRPDSPNDQLYDNQLPDIGGVWPGTENIQKPKPDVNTNVESTPTNTKPVVEVEKQSWFSYLREQGFGWLQALGLAGIIGIIATIWKFKKPKVTEKIDEVQDNLQSWAQRKFGAEFATELRDLLEGLETMVIGTVDSVLISQKTAKMNAIQEQLAKLKGLVDVKQMPTEVDVQNLLAAVKAAAADPNEPNVSVETAKKVEEIIAKTK